jgi:predicted DNA-binding transcriptional regulator YafY
MIDTARLLSMAENLSRYVQFEKRKSTGSEHLYGVIHAIKSRFRVNFSYRPFWEEGKQEEKRTVDPLLLKEFKTRWYLMAIDRKDDV